MKQGGAPTLKRKNNEFLGRQHVADSEDSDRPATGGGWSRKAEGALRCMERFSEVGWQPGMEQEKEIKGTEERIVTTRRRKEQR
jgi:hypothetical protein